MPAATGSLPRVLVFAYACEPGRGSEPGAGWAIVEALSTMARCVVLVGPEHMPGIRRWQSANPDAGLTFIEVLEPWWGPHAKHHRLTWFPLYLAWLRRARRTAARLHRVEPFQLAYHATYSVFWLPTPATSLGLPSVWGPVGGAVTTPRPLWGALGPLGLVGEVVDAVAVRLLAQLPVTRRSCRSATVRLVQNEATRASLPAGFRDSAIILNHASLIRLPAVTEERPHGGPFVSLAALERRKGVELTIRALQHASPKARLVVAGKGPRRRTLERLAARLGVADRVSFIGPIDRNQLLALCRSAAGAVFTGLREEGGLALAEALLCGVPVIVLANGGAATIARAAIDQTRVVLIQPASADKVARAIGQAMSNLIERRDAPPGGPNLDSPSHTATLRAAVRRALRSHD